MMAAGTVSLAGDDEGTRPGVGTDPRESADIAAAWP
jgi:hypothetical protein